MLPAAPLRRLAHSIAFFGSDRTSALCLGALIPHIGGPCVREITVITPPDRRPPRQRRAPPPLIELASAHGLPVETLPDTTTLRGWALPRRYDLGVVVSFGYFITRSVLGALDHGAINVHPSLLPRHRGPAPVHHTLLAGDAQTGVCVIEISPDGFDVGRVLARHEEPVRPDDTTGALTTRLMTVGAGLMVDTVCGMPASLEAGQAQASFPQEATRAPKVSRGMGLLSFAEMDAHEVYRRWQALGDNVGVYGLAKLPGAAQPVQIKLVDLSHPGPSDGSAAPGTAVLRNKAHLEIECAGATRLQCHRLVLPGKPPRRAVDFGNSFLKGKAVELFMEWV